MDIEQRIAEDRKIGLRPEIGLIILHHRMMLLGRQAGGLSIIKRWEPFLLDLDQSEWKLAWEIPQGGIDPGESISVAFWREALEELGSWMGAISEPEFIHRA